TRCHAGGGFYGSRRGKPVARSGLKPSTRATRGEGPAREPARAATIAAKKNPRRGPGAISGVVGNHHRAGFRTARALGTSCRYRHARSTSPTRSLTPPTVPPCRCRQATAAGTFRWSQSLLRDEAVIGDGTVARAAATAQAHFL